MRKILVALPLFFLSFSFADAGLFEYQMNGTLDSYVKNVQRDPDVIDQINIPSYNTYPGYYNQGYNTNSYNNLNYNTSYYDTSYYNSYNNSNTIHANTFTVSRTNTYYSYDDLRNMLISEITDLNNEINFITARQREIEYQKNNRYYYYSTIKTQLQSEYDALETRRKVIEARKTSATTELRNLEGNRRYGQTDYYSYSELQYNNYTRYLDTCNYNYDSRYNYNTSNYYRDPCSYDYYESNLQPSWVNPNLKEVKD